MARLGSGPRRVALTLIAVAVVAVAALFVVTIRGCACTPLPAITSPVDGVVVEVTASSLSNVAGFRLKVGGWIYDFKLGALENATQFSPSHLAEHQATSIPVRVWYLDRDGQHVVYRLEDAAAGSPRAT